MTKAIFFDLDGTLTDSGEGIMNCAALALEHYGIRVPDRSALRVFVGPPLRDSFLRFGIREADIPGAIEVFRGRYASVGKFENVPYPGIHEMLQRLRQNDWRLFVATSKPEVMALEIMEKFRLSPFFERICGASLDATRTSKEQVIRYLLEQIGTPDRIVMVGDTAFDAEGAACFGIPTVGVSWGYGDVPGLLQAGAAAIADTPEQLTRLLNAEN